MTQLLSGQRAAQLIGLPDDCVAATIRIRPGKPVVVTTMSYFKNNENNSIALVARCCALVELNSEWQKG